MSEGEEEASKSDPETYEQMVVASGIISIHFFDLLKQLTTFRTEGPTRSDRASAMARFGRLFMGKLWDVYARSILTAGPL